MVAYSVTGRTREIGVRMALGAGRIAVMGMVLRQVAVTTAAGLLFGVPAAIALARAVESQLYGVKPEDPLSLAAACAGVVLITALAAFLPARSATRIDPVRALRWE
jgi:ABC-type antimicrobial peptide transport system permease subunit